METSPEGSNSVLDCATLRIVGSSSGGFTVSVPNSLLLSWHSQALAKADFVDQFNRNIQGSAFLVERTCVRLASRLAGAASALKSKSRKLRPGRARMQLHSGSTSFEASENH